MTSKKFDIGTQALLEPVTTGELKFMSMKTGAIFNAGPDDTLLVSESIGEVDILGKYQNTIRTTAYDSTNPRVKIDGGCPKCKRLVVSFQRLGTEKKVVYVCSCGYSWT